MQGMSSQNHAEENLLLTQMSSDELYKLQALRTSAALQQAEQTQKIESIEHKKYTFWVTILLLFISWCLITYVRVSQKWQYMIKRIDAAHKQGSKYTYSGFFTALALEYPIVTRFKIFNPNLPEAVKLAYFSNATAPDMAEYTSDDYLYQLELASEKCGPDAGDSAFCSSLSIWCYVFKGEAKEDCLPACTNPASGGVLAYAGAAAGWGINMGFAGHMMGKGLAEGAYAGPMAGAGFAIGIGFGIWGAYNSQQQQRSQCENQRQNCYAAPGTPPC